MRAIFPADEAAIMFCAVTFQRIEVTPFLGKRSKNTNEFWIHTSPN